MDAPSQHSRWPGALLFEQIRQFLNEQERPLTLLNKGEKQKNGRERTFEKNGLPLQPEKSTDND